MREERYGTYTGRAVRDVYRKIVVRDVYRRNGQGCVEEEQCGINTGEAVSEL